MVRTSSSITSSFPARIFSATPGADMVGQQFLAEGVHRRVGCGRLRQDVGAVGVFLQHALQTADLALDPVQPVHQALVFLVRADLGLLAAAFFHDGHLVLSDTPLGYLDYIPLQGILSRWSAEFFSVFPFLRVKNRRQGRPVRARRAFTVLTTAAANPQRSVFPSASRAAMAGGT